jgi:hypothetical protein
MTTPKGFTPCSVTGEYVEGFWEMTFVYGDEGERSIKLRVGAKDIDKLFQVVGTGRRLLKYEDLVQAQERLQSKRRKPLPPAVFHHS